MSTFNGEIAEIQSISVDHFENKNQKCYFLSHCHTDHMRGLATLDGNAPIYVSLLSALFIERQHPRLKHRLKILEVGITVLVELNEDESGSAANFTVTTLPAGHCVGSVMLLFQNDQHDILYTGDFRMSADNVTKVKAFNELRSKDNVVIYLDSTFMNPSFPKFPTQSESVNEIVEIVKNFLKVAHNRKVFLEVPARYGYEYLIMELGKKLNERIFVCESSHDELIAISEISSHVTNDCKNSRIHLKLKYNKTNEPNDGAEILRLQLSAMFWRNWTGASFVKQTNPNCFRVCYATHCSYTEIQDFLLHLKPKTVHLDVLPSDAHGSSEMLNNLKKIQSQYSSEVSSVGDAPKKFTFKNIHKKPLKPKIK